MNLRKNLLILAWATFAVSLLLPAIKSEGFFGFLPEIYWGFMCVAVSVLGIVVFLVNIVALLFGKDLETVFAYFALFGLCNLLMLLSPALIFLERKSVYLQKAALKAVFKAAYIVAALSVCLHWFLFPEERADFLAGYYVWCLSYILLAVAVNLRVVRQP